MLALLLAAAAAPSILLPSSGRLLDASDNPATGTATLVFTFFDAATEGDSLWTDTFTTPVDDGIYSVLLGDTSATGHAASALASDLFTTTTWLEIAANGETLSPRLRIGVIPLAGAVTNGDATVSLDSSGKWPASSLEIPANLATLDSDGHLTSTELPANVATLDASGHLATSQIPASVVQTSGAAGIDASLIVSGTLADGRLGGTYSGALTLSNPANSVTANDLTGVTLASTTTSGPPLTVASTVEVPNLNAALLGGHPVTDLVLAANLTPAQNLAHNGGFENFLGGAGAPPNWYASAATFDATNSGITEVAGLDGNGVQLKDLDSNGSVVLKQIILPTASAAMAGRVYSAGVSFRSDFAPVSGQLCLSDAGPDGGETSQDCVPLAGATAWQRASVTHTMSSSPAYLKVTLSPTPPAVAGAATYQFDELAVVPGAGSTAYVTNPEDAFAGMIAAFASGCPYGWSEYVAARGRVLRGEPSGNPGALIQGGSDNAVLIAHTHEVAGTTAAAGAHTHNVSGTTDTQGAHTHSIDGFDYNGSGANGGSFPGGTPFALNHPGCASAGAHSHNVTGTTDSQGSHTHTFDVTSVSAGSGNGVGANIPSYQATLFCVKL